MIKTIEQTIFEMITENTGTHFLDSGGEGGRNWQRNKGKSLDDLKNQPAATLCFYGIERDDSGKIIDATPEIDVSIFHKLTSGILELDDLCHQFNSMACNDWQGDYYGVSRDQSEWLADKGFKSINDDWNTYNWENNFSQVLQGTDLELNGGSLCVDGGNYVLIQIHGGADVRGGYTDAKLFRLADHCEHYAVIMDDCGFSLENPAIESETPDIFTGETRDNIIGLDWHGEWITRDGGCAVDDDFLLMAQVNDGQPIHGDQFNDF